MHKNFIEDSQSVHIVKVVRLYVYLRRMCAPLTKRPTCHENGILRILLPRAHIGLSRSHITQHGAGGQEPSKQLRAQRGTGCGILASRATQCRMHHAINERMHHAINENQSSSFLSRNTLLAGRSTCSSQAAVRRAQLWGPVAQLPKPNGERAMAVEVLLRLSTAPNDGIKSTHHATAADAPSSVIAVEWNQPGG